MKILVVIVFIFFAQTSFGQKVSDCGIFYDRPDFEAKFGYVKADLHTFVIDELLDIIVKTDHLYPEKLKLNFKIDAKGKVLSIDFLKIVLSDKCKSELNKKILAMPAWQPAMVDGKEVCSNYSLKIPCINWQ